MRRLTLACLDITYRTTPCTLSASPTMQLKSPSSKLLVDVVRGEGKAAGRAWPLYLPMGAVTDDAIRAKTKTMLDVLDEWKDVIRDLNLDHPE